MVRRVTRKNKRASDRDRGAKALWLCGYKLRKVYNLASNWNHGSKSGRKGKKKTHRWPSSRLAKKYHQVNWTDKKIRFLEEIMDSSNEIFMVNSTVSLWTGSVGQNDTARTNKTVHWISGQATNCPKINMESQLPSVPSFFDSWTISGPWSDITIHQAIIIHWSESRDQSVSFLNSAANETHLETVANPSSFGAIPGANVNKLLQGLEEL